MKTFLKPLSKEEERECLEALKGSDGVKAREAKQKLIERNLRLVAHIAKKYQNVDEDMEDLISIGTIGLIKAVDSFDAAKNSKLATYAARCIDNELLMMLRSKKKTSREVSLYEPIGTDREGNEISLLDVTAQEMPDIVERLELERSLGQLAGMIDHLPALRPSRGRRSDPAGDREKAGHFKKLCFQNREKSAFEAAGGL